MAARPGGLSSIVDTSPQDWRYVSEGGATMVFSYIGDPLLHPQFAGMVLRLRKISLESSAGDSQDCIFLDADADEPDDPMIEFQHSIMERLISPEHLPRLLSVRVEHEWLHDLVNLHDGYRPPARRKKDCVDLKRTKAVIATDLVGGNGLAVEIKPKWAFLPSPTHLSPHTLPIKTRTCRFCMHAHYRSKGDDSGPVSYCPLDLFSGDDARIQTAVHNLWDGWVSSEGSANNLRIFANGQMIKPINPSSMTLLKHELKVEDDTSDLSVLRAQFWASIGSLLMETPVLRTLARLQRTLDVLDIEGISKLWALSLKKSPEEVTTVIDDAVDSIPEIGADFPEPSIDDWKRFVDEYLSSHSHLDHSTPKLASLRYYILAYLLSATFKDCSIMIRIGQRHEPGDKGTITVIDLDPKSIQRLSKWEKLDRDIVKAYTGSESKKCVDDWRPCDDD